MIVGAVLSAILLLTLIAFPRHLKSVVICLLLIWTTTAAFVIYDWWRGSKRLEHIIATADFDASCPDAALPIRVSFRNDNNVAVQRLTYTLEGFEPAFRASVTFDPYQVSERRIEAGETFSACRSFRLRGNERAEPQRLEWRVTVVSAEFD
ncbi:hypothetical protein O3S81_02010 [Agrobacterium sp. SOY23]|uniref:hypothetical protein n=1 Tax=Agrobacterium sp. SOY23 TaxID=3014555 RepID=UPI001B2D27BA|nr:hypothetical protein [Agrobacterium sp. SOY23]MBO9656536.1 hypothetical protein [Agrobacterium tumefaciens]MCZ4428467.1 hypothetical protein [Agrobacterium sp. SOY23]